MATGGRKEFGGRIQQAQEMIQKRYESLFAKANYPQLSKADAIKFICFIEAKKSEATVRTQTIMTQNPNVPENVLNQMMTLEKAKAIDELFIEFGVEEI